MRFLERALTRFHAEAKTAEEAIREAGELLLHEQVVEPRYINAMVDSYRKNGPYFVIAPRIALPHARGEDGAREAAVALLHLREPVAFGHQTNDPVQLVFALACGTDREHIELIQKLTRFLANPDHLEGIYAASRYEDVEALLKGGET